MSVVPMLAGVGLLMVCCSSSSVAAMMMGGEKPEEPKEPEGPPCVKDKSFTEQTGSFECESTRRIQTRVGYLVGTWINNSVPISSTEAEAAGMSHTFHELSSSANEKKYIAMRKTDQHYKMVQFDITKEGNTCSYKN